MRRILILLILAVIAFATCFALRSNAESNICYLPTAQQLQVKYLKDKINSLQIKVQNLKNENLQYSSEIKSNNASLMKLKQKEIYLRSTKHKIINNDPNNRLVKNPLSIYKMEIKKLQISNLKLKNKVNTNKTLIFSVNIEIENTENKLNKLTNKNPIA